MMPLNKEGKFDSMMKIDVVKNDDSTKMQIGQLFTLVNEAVYQLSCFWARDHPSCRYLQEISRKHLQDTAAEIYLALTGEKVTLQGEKPTSGDGQEYDFILTMTDLDSTIYFTGFKHDTGLPTWGARDTNDMIRYKSMPDAVAVASKLYTNANGVIEIVRVPREKVS